MHWILAAAILAVVQTPGGGPVAGGSLCNDQTRHVTTTGGNSSTGTANCASITFSITIAGQSMTFTSPPSCDTGRREQSTDCFDCGPASEGNHCKARGFKANVKIYSVGGGNPCPQMPDPLPTTIAAANAAVSCAPLPLTSNTDVWCASVSTCEGNAQRIQDPVEPSLILGSGKGARSYWAGQSFDLDWSRLAPRSEFDAWVRTLPREPLTALPPAMQGALNEVLDIEGAEVVGVLDIIYFQGGAPWVTNRFDFTGLITKGGLHVRERSFVPDEDAEISAREESLIHDGRMLLIESDAGTVGQAYMPGYFDLSAVLRARLAPYALLESWLKDLLCVQRLVGTKYESLGDGKGQLVVIETYPGMKGPGAEGSTIYRFGDPGAFPRVSSVEYRSGDGSTRVLREFSAWSEVTDGNFRPNRVVETRFGEKGELERRTSLELRSVRAMSLARARARGWLAPRSAEWLIYQ